MDGGTINFIHVLALVGVADPMPRIKARAMPTEIFLIVIEIINKNKC
jgi:hypothetical protein